MQTTKTIEFQCPNCGMPSTAPVTTIIDPAHNPEAKQQLLSGRLNLVQCPNCGTASPATTPLVYHDAHKELLISFVPMQLGLSDIEADKFIGMLTRQVTDATDSKLIKGYIFQPRRSLTIQGLIEQVLESDGVSREMMDEQKERSRLVQMFLQTDPSTYVALVEEHDDKLDEQFFQTMSIVSERYAQEGRENLAEQVLIVQEQIASLSTVGKQLIKRGEEQEQIVRVTAEALQSLGNRPTPAEVIALVKPHATDENRLQAFVGLARPIFDYAFFEALTAEIENASDAERLSLEKMRDAILQLTQMVDQQAEMQLQSAANVLRQVLSSPDPEEAIQVNLGQIDDTFMTVLELNINEAQRQGDIEASVKMKDIRDKVIDALQQRMRPEMRFVNDLLLAETEKAAREMLETHAKEYGTALLDMFDTISDIVAGQGETHVVERLALLRVMTEEILA